ncbi:unnamed protein product [Cochlearia groenlandica]
MNPPAKGTVTPLASIFSEEEAKKAASYVEEKIGEKREEMNRLQQFVDENESLVNLVKTLPDKLHHNVMVPFGKLAFFPGRLIHTNECLVLLGENYYTDRTSKQTVEFLRRRDKTLQTQIHSLKAEIKDFQTEASFFTATASEAAEGLVEIREDYEEEEEDSSPLHSSVKEPSVLEEEETAEGEVEDDEFARMMSRLDELEMEEELDGEDGDNISEEQESPIESVEEIEHEMIKGIKDETDHKKIERGKETILSVPEKASDLSSSICEPIYSEPRDKGKFIEVLPEDDPHKDPIDPKSCVGRKPYLPKEDQSRDGTRQRKSVTWKDLQEVTSGLSSANAKSDVVGPQRIESPIQKPEYKFDGNKAFIGKIVEHTDNLDTNNTHGQVQSSGTKPSKRVSRFMAERR